MTGERRAAVAFDTYNAAGWRRDATSRVPDGQRFAVHAARFVWIHPSVRQAEGNEVADGELFSPHVLCSAPADVPNFVGGTTMQVRRLTPRECERLQGFPDDYTLTPAPRQARRRWAALQGAREQHGGSSDFLVRPAYSNGRGSIEWQGRLKKRERQSASRWLAAERLILMRHAHTPAVITTVTMKKTRRPCASTPRGAFSGIGKCTFVGRIGQLRRNWHRCGVSRKGGAPSLVAA